jgi:hypothetical protein
VLTRLGLNVKEDSWQQCSNSGENSVINFLYERLMQFDGLKLRTQNKEYQPITGVAQFNKLSARLILGANRCVLF